MPRRIFPFLPAGLILLAACTATTPGPETAEPVQSARASSPQAELNYQLLLGEVALMREAHVSAAAAYREAMQLTDDPGIAERAMQLSLLVALRREDYDAAVEHAEHLLESWPGDSGDRYRALGRLLIGETGREPVVELLERLAERHDAAEAWHMLGLLALRGDRPEVAQRAVQRARELQPDWTPGAMLEARVLAYRERYTEAVELLAPVVEAHPADPQLRFALAGIHIAAGDEAAAVTQLERTLEHSPDYLDAHWTLGLLLLRDERPDAAEAHLRELLDDPSRRGDASYYIAGAYEQREDWAGALDWFDRVESGNQRVNARIKAADMLFRLDRHAEARARLDALRGEAPAERTRIWHAEAELLRRNDRAGEALAVYARAIEDLEDSGQLRFARALLLERMGRLDDAIADLEALHERDPESAEAQNSLGYVLADRGHADDLPRARQLIEQALAQEPRNPAYLDSMGWVLFRLGELEPARGYLERAWLIMPSGEIGAHLGEVLWELGDKDAARAIWEEAAVLETEQDVLEETMERLLDE